MPPTVTGYQILESAYKYQGVPYSQGKQGKPPAGTGFDCSGLVQQALADLGITIGRTTSVQLADANSGVIGKNIGTDKKQAQIGDIIHYVGHEEIWATTPNQKAPPQVFSESTYGQVAATRDATNWPVIGIVRYAGAAGTPSPMPGQGTDQGAVSGQLADLIPGVNSLVGMVTSLVKFVGFLADPANWWRVGLAAFGTVLLILALFRLTKPPTIALTNTVRKVTNG